MTVYIESSFEELDGKTITKIENLTTNECDRHIIHLSNGDKYELFSHYISSTGYHLCKIVEEEKSEGDKK